MDISTEITIYRLLIEISTKIRIYRLLIEYIDRNKIYRLLIGYIDEKPNISTKIELYRRKYEYIGENNNISIFRLNSTPTRSERAYCICTYRRPASSSAFSSRISSAVNGRDRLRNRTPSTPSSENMPPLPSTTSMMT